MYAAYAEWELLAPDFTRGACAGRAPMWDYDIAGEQDRARDARFAAALAGCDACPIKRECRDWAVTEKLTGLWGGQIYAPTPNNFSACEVCGIKVHGYRKDRSDRRIPPLCRACSVG